MSKVDKKGVKTPQQSLDLQDSSVQKEQDGDLDFVLKIHDGHLHDLEISSVANLLSALGRIVDVKQTSFNTIKEGSTTIAVTVPNDCRSLAISNVMKDTAAKHKQIARIQKGRDKSDYITIILNNDMEVPAQCSKKLLEELHPYFNTDKSLRFEGEATYLSKSNSYQLTLKKYIINKFHVIEDVSLVEWIDDFRAKGASNWSTHDDPIAEWIMSW